MLRNYVKTAIRALRRRSGLPMLAVTRREKQIGVRKVLGGSVLRVAATLSKEYLALVGLAVVLAMPGAYWLMRRGLQEFAVRIDLGPGLFVLSGLLAMIVAAATVGLQTVRAARLDPATTLREE
jgi:putative ABC transport system permease protein